MENDNKNISNDEIDTDFGLDLDKIEEYRVFLKTCNSFYYYAMEHLTALKKRSDDFKTLTEEKELQSKTLNLPIYQKFQQTKICIKVNFEFLKELVNGVEGVFFDPEELEYIKLVINQQNDVAYPTQLDMDKVSSTLKQLTRDWSSIGKKEREGAYLPICGSLLKEYGSMAEEDRYDIKVLVPGAGLGRLVYDIAKLGFSSEGNEFSYPMLITSYYLLNKCTEQNQFKIYPYCTNYSNNWSGRDQFLPVEIPDELPSNLGNNIKFSMSAGDFIEAYGLESDHKENWDCVATCFFIDTAKNVCDYVDIIYNLLKPNSIWINLGPLLYHFDNSASDMSIELTWDELKLYILAKGFIIEEEEKIICQYTANINSMLQYNYNCIKFVARKPSLMVN